MHESEVIRGNCGNLLFNRGRLTLCTAYLFPSEGFHPLPCSLPLAQINNGRTWGNVTVIFNSKHAFELADPIHHRRGGGIYMCNSRGGRYGTCAQGPAEEGVSALFRPGGSGCPTVCLSYKCSCARAWSNIFKCLRLPGPLLYLISRYIALSDLEDCLKFTGTDQDFRMCFGCLLSAVKVLSANSLNHKGHRWWIIITLSCL